MRATSSAAVTLGCWILLSLPGVCLGQAAQRVPVVTTPQLIGSSEPEAANDAQEEIESKQIWNLSREGFIQELVHAKATPRTPQFDDYTPGSYHVEKIDLLEGVRARRATRNPQIKGLLVVGPVGPLWSYYVTLFVEEKEGVRAIDVTFPHARMTFKQTKLFSPREHKKLMGKLIKSGALLEGMPSFDTIGRPRNDQLSLEWHYDVLLADWSSGKERIFHSAVPEADMEPFLKALDLLSENAVVTYSGDLSEDESVYNRIEETPPN